MRIVNCHVEGMWWGIDVLDVIWAKFWIWASLLTSKLSMPDMRAKMELQYFHGKPLWINGTDFFGTHNDGSNGSGCVQSSGGWDYIMWSWWSSIACWDVGSRWSWKYGWRLIRKLRDGDSSSRNYSRVGGNDYLMVGG